MLHPRPGTGFPAALVLGLAALACTSGGQGSSNGSGGNRAATSGTGGSSAASTGGSTGSGGATGLGGATGSGAAGGAPASAGCDRMLSPLRTTGTIVELTFSVFFENAPFVYGEPNTLPDGSIVTPSNFRFYVSSFELMTDSGSSRDVDLVDEAQALLPYGVHLYVAEDEASHTLRVLAPPGKYTGARFVLGLRASCNSADQSNRWLPLDDSSQMTWGPLGYLFLRYESRVDRLGPGIPIAVHMGGDRIPPDVPGVVIALDGALEVPATGTLGKTIRVQMDQIFAGAMKGVDLTLPPAVMSEIDNGNRLRLAAPDLRLFGFAP